MSSSSPLSPVSLALDRMVEGGAFAADPLQSDAAQVLDRIADEAVLDAAAADGRRQALAHCLQKLPEKHRSMVASRYEPGASVNMMAAAMGKQPKAVSETLRRIRRTLLDCIESTLAAKAAV